MEVDNDLIYNDANEAYVFFDIATGGLSLKKIYFKLL